MPLTSDEIEEIERFWNSPALGSAIIGDADVKKIREDFDRAASISGRGPHYKPPEDLGRLIARSIASQARLRIEAVKKSICKYACPTYCKHKKRLKSEGLQVAISIADSLIAAKTSIPIPITLVSVYIVKEQMLEQWCTCP